MLRFGPIPILKDIMGTLVFRQKDITLVLRRHYECRILINIQRGHYEHIGKNVGI
jgi:hypothetical protein